MLEGLVSLVEPNDLSAPERPEDNDGGRVLESAEKVVEHVGGEGPAAPGIAIRPVDDNCGTRQGRE